MSEHIINPTREDWPEHAVCAQVGHETWDALTEAHRGRPGAADDIEFARYLCTTCPLIAPCLKRGMCEAYGFWGGLTEKERETIRRLAA